MDSDFYTTPGLDAVTKDGRTEDSETATMHYETLITAQPEDITIHSRQNVKFEVVSADGCTYQWYYRRNAASRWIPVTNNGTSASYTTVGSADRDGWQFCCKVMQGNASELSEVATLHYLAVK